MTDGDPVPTSALRAPDGKVGLRVDAAAGDKPTHLIWTGFLIPPASGTYRLGVSGASTELTFDGKVLVTPGARVAADLPTFAIVTLEKGRRYPVRISGEPRFGSRSPGLLLEAVSLQAEQNLVAAAANAGCRRGRRGTHLGSRGRGDEDRHRRLPPAATRLRSIFRRINASFSNRRKRLASRSSWWR